MRHFKRVAASLGMALALAACGGGSGEDVGGAFFTSTGGKVTSVDGQSANVAGVEIAAPDHGKRSTSDASGDFELGTLPAQPVEIVVTSPGGAADRVMVDLTGGGAARMRLEVTSDGVARMSVEHCSGSESEAETRVAMTAVQPGFKGKIEIEAKARGDQKLEIEAEHLTPGQTIEITIADAAGRAESLGVFTANALGEIELEIETENGGTLPLGAATVQELEGATVDVVDTASGDVLLTGVVPVLAAMPDNCDGDDDHEDDRGEGRSRLMNAAGVTGEARVELESRPDRAEEEFEVKVERSNVTDTMECWLEDPANAGVLVHIGTLRVDEDGDRELEFETDDGDTLPFGVSGVAELVGLAVEIRQASDGAVVFSGSTPPVR